MARPNKHRLTCDIDLDIIEGLDSIVEQDRRYWHRTHLINEALRMFMDRWEEDREDDPYEDASDQDDDDDDDEDDEDDQGDLFDQDDDDEDDE